jgi:hypothetical protein
VQYVLLFLRLAPRIDGESHLIKKKKEGKRKKKEKRNPSLEKGYEVLWHLLFYPRVSLIFFHNPKDSE